MLNTHHPDDERLAAFADGDPDAAADGEFESHVAACERCSGLIEDLRLLRSALSELPDLAPTRPLRLVPPIEDSPPSVGWVRRLFGPALAAGAGLAIVGLVGTTAPVLEGMASQAGPEATEAAADHRAAEDGEVAAPAAASAPADGAEGYTDSTAHAEAAGEGDSTVSDEAAELPTAERSIWPMLLFTGIALMLAAALLRWILVPRAG